MSKENVEVVRHMYESFYSGEFEAALGRFDQDVVVDASKGRPDIGIGHGREQVRRFVTTWLGTWHEFQEEIEEMRDLGSRVLVLSVHHGAGQGERGLKWRRSWPFSMTFRGGRSLA